MKDHGRNRLPALLFALILLLCAQAAFVRPALAGWNEVIVSTDGNGVPVYASSSGSKQAGIIYNGYRSEISLEPTNDRYSLSLTPDYTVWLNEEKATNRLPARSDYAGLDDWAGSSWPRLPRTVRPSIRPRNTAICPRSMCGAPWSSCAGSSEMTII